VLAPPWVDRAGAMIRMPPLRELPATRATNSPTTGSHDSRPADTRHLEILDTLLDSVRRFVRECLVPAEAEVARTDRLFRLYEGTSQIQQLIIARNMIREATS
jgi:hypothetical protein